jgi:hypothetical protein
LAIAAKGCPGVVSLVLTLGRYCIVVFGRSDGVFVAIAFVGRSAHLDMYVYYLEADTTVRSGTWKS